MKKFLVMGLVVLGITWLFMVPNLVAQDKEFKSELNDIKNPKEARWIIVGHYNASALLYAEWEGNLDTYFQNSKINSWLNDGKFALGDLKNLRSSLNKTYEYLEKAVKLLNLPTKDGQIPVPVGACQSSEENESYQGTLEDVRKAEEYIYKANQLLDVIKESPILELIKKDKEGYEESNSTPRIWYHIQLGGDKNGKPGYYEGSVSANTEIVFNPEKPELICKHGGYFSVYDSENCIMYANFDGKLEILDWRIWSLIIITEIEGRTSKHESWYKRTGREYKEMTPKEIQELKDSLKK